jgi:hypothetical protein
MLVVHKQTRVEPKGSMGAGHDDLLRAALVLAEFGKTRQTKEGANDDRLTDGFRPTFYFRIRYSVTSLPTTSHQ